MSGMTEKHFEEVAATLNSFYVDGLSDDSDRNLIAAIGRDLAYGFLRENPRFDHQRFMNAVTAERRNG